MAIGIDSKRDAAYAARKQIGALLNFSASAHYLVDLFVFPSSEHFISGGSVKARAAGACRYVFTPRKKRRLVFVIHISLRRLSEPGSSKCRRKMPRFEGKKEERNGRSVFN